MNDYDSLLTHTPLSPLVQTQEYLSGRQLPDADVAGLLRAGAQSSDQWVVVSVIAMLVVLLFVLVTNVDFLTYRVKDFFTSERRFSNVRKQTTAAEVMTVAVPIGIGILSLSLFGFDFIRDIPLLRRRVTDIHWLYLLPAALCVGWVVLKSVFYALVNWVFSDSASSRKWMSSYFFLTSLFGALMLPLAIVYLFTPMTLTDVADCLFIALILYEILILYRMNANFQVKMYGKLMIFLYFCTAEILPVLVAGHFVQKVAAL